MSGFGTCRMLLNESLIHFAVSLLSQLKANIMLITERILLFYHGAFSMVYQLAGCVLI